jgi:hypothetical protein
MILSLLKPDSHLDISIETTFSSKWQFCADVKQWRNIFVLSMEDQGSFYSNVS